MISRRRYTHECAIAEPLFLLSRASSHRDRMVSKSLSWQLKISDRKITVLRSWVGTYEISP